MSAHVGTVRAHHGFSVHVSVRDAHVEIVAADGSDARESVIVVSPLVGRALAKLIQTAAHEGQRERSALPGKR